MKTRFTRIAIAAAVTGAIALPASGAMAASKTERALLGGLLGAVAGAAISDGRTEGVAIGAVAGAALGAATSKDRRYRSSYRQTRPYYANSQYRSYDRQGDGRYYGQGYYDQSRYDQSGYDQSGYDRYDRYDRYDGYRR